ncbi:MAG: hypothetical protein F9K19_00125 [Rhizobiaceae bacterium]|nr:MAG: hypothetical protein F9K19_00125 [Rhizobiaceae bacterium]CAG1014060.1 hypothetical protein RHIZO_04680 [Rhizobiaceae bacterium]
MRRLILLATLAFTSVPASAEQDGRYRLEKTPDGYVRMDTQTGEMSLCEMRGGQLVCKLAADERSALQDEIDRLATRLSGVEERLAKIENSPILKPENLLPTEEEFQRSLGLMEQFFRKFLGIVKEMDEELGGGESGKTATPPQKT